MANQKYGFIISMERCIGCNACTISCKSYYNLNPSINRRFVREVEETLVGEAKRCHISTACNHCEEPGCAKACPTGAYTKLDNGIVKHNQDRCIGCKMCATACPYGVPQFDPVKKKMDKCSLCVELLEVGEETICMASCPMEVIQVVDLNETETIGLVDRVNGFVNPDITKSTTLFKLPDATHTVRRDL